MSCVRVVTPAVRHARATLYTTNVCGLTILLPLVAGDQPGGLGRYNVLCAGHSFVRGLDLFCVIDRGKYPQ